jgi:UDP-N-acetylglucosamine 2-epimerase
VRIALIGSAHSPAIAPSLVEALGAEGFAVEHHELRAGARDGATAALVEALREAEALLASDPPDAVAVSGDSDVALGAALVAVKLEIPTAWLGAGEAAPELSLVARVAHAALHATGDAATLAAAIAGMAAPTLPGR